MEKVEDDVDGRLELSGSRVRSNDGGGRRSNIFGRPDGQLNMRGVGSVGGGAVPVGRTTTVAGLVDLVAWRS